jgi:site-specific DNA recombinase
VIKGLAAHLMDPEKPAIVFETHPHRIAAHISRIEVRKGALAILLKRPDPDGPSGSQHRNCNPEARNKAGSDDWLQIPWRKPPSKKPRKIQLPASASGNPMRPIRAERRAALVKSIARGREWLDQIVTGAVTDVSEIATRHHCSVRHVNMTISMAFVAPALIRAAIEGRLPRGVGVASLRDAPAEWSRQLERLGLAGHPTP